MYLKSIKFNKKNKTIFSLCLFLSTMILSGIMGQVAVINDSSTNLTEDDVFNDEFSNNNKPSLSAYSNCEWWNDTWDYRIPVNVSANGAIQNNVPVELLVNFTQYFFDGDINNPELNKNSIRIVEYTSITDYVIIPCQFDQWSNYDNQSNAIGDVIWIMNGTTAASATRIYFIYFDNGTDPEISDPGYDTIRLWHEGFEETSSVLGYTDGQDVHPTSYEISTSVSTRGNRSLLIWGNCWKASYVGTTIIIGSNTRVTAKMRFDDPSIAREISGIGFGTGTGGIPSPAHSYNIRGNQPWGLTTYKNLYYADNTFFWYTFDLYTDMTLTSFTHIAYEADDDSYNDLNLYWDDISIWNQPVSTVPDHMVQFSIGEIEPVSYSLKITCVDIDGFRIPNAHVYISNSSKSYLDQDDLTNSDGDVLFVNVSRTDRYDIIVNFTMQGVSVPLTETVATLDNYKPPELHSEIILTLELWAINFNITDIDGNPVEYGFIELQNNTDTVGNGTLNQNGETQVIWRNQSSYNYSVYLNYGAMPDEATYYNEHLSIYNGTISRSDPNGPQYNQSIVDITDPGVETREVGNDLIVEYEWEPTNYGRIYSYNLSFINMTDYIEYYYIYDENDTIVDSFFDNGENHINFSAHLNYTNLGKIHVELRKEKGKLSPNNGTFSIIYVRSTKENIQVNISTIHFTVLDTNEEKLENAIIRIYNNTASPKVSIANLTVQEDGTARFIYFTYGDIFNPGNFSMILYFAGQNRNINKTYYNFTDDTTDWIAIINEGLNFTLISETWNTTVVNVNILEWTTKIENIYSTTTTVYWRDHIFVRVNFSAKGESTEATWIKYAIVDNDFSEITDYFDLENEPDIGIYNLTFDTSILSGGQNYFVKVIASKSGYSDPDYLAVSFSPLEILTDIQIYNYTSWQPYTSNNITKYWGETLYLTVRYFEQTTSVLIGGAGVSMKWNFGDDIMLQDPSKAAGFYTIFFDTSEAPTIGKYLLEFSADKGNFSASTENFFINIINRPTTINNKTQLDRIYKEIYVEDPYNFTFTFRDNLTGGTLTDLDSHYYIWELYDEEGNVTESGSAFLNETGTGSHVLDFATENRTVGDFLLFVTLDKNNYDYATALISLKIKLREITSDLVGVEGSQINSIQGDVITIKLKLTDPTRNNVNLTGAIVNLTIGDTIYAFTDDDGDGVYEYDFTTAEINAFIMSQTLTGQIEYWAQNHHNYTMEVTIVVGMSEIFPGMPTFYFILILAIVIVGVGGIVGYRVVQQARIPAFVKKTRSMAKSMKGGKSISASIKIPTKEDYIVDTLKSYWEKLGLSIEDTLGIKGKKFEEIKKESIETKKELPEAEIEHPEPEKEALEPEREYPEPEKEIPEPEREPSEPEREYPEPEKEALEPEREPSEPEMEYPEPEREPSEPEMEYPEVEKEPPETEKEYDENQEGGSEE